MLPLLAPLLVLLACPPPDAEPPADDPEDTDTNADSADSGDPGTDTDSGDPGDSGDTDSADTGQSLPLGAACDPSADACGTGTACCTACCAPDAEPECTALDADGACPLPDLTVDVARMAGSVDVQDVWIPEGDCAIAEACVGGPGMRRLMRFATTTPNVGTADLFYGDPSRGDGFAYSECHGHHHFESYAAFELLGFDGTTVASGRKQAFCLMDTEPWTDDATGIPRYDCGYQGISAGWADTYEAYYDCQWIDVTEVPAGDYVLRVSLNTERRFPERSYDDNVAEVAVTLRAPADEPPVTEPCAGESYGVGRNCGWSDAGAFACTPGEEVTLGCEGACDGSCWYDTVLRLCDGASCRGADAIASNDDSTCGSACSSATVTCPASGTVRALVGAWDASRPETCAVTRW
jgi:hypothetical protein